MSYVEVSDIRKTYSDVTAVENISFKLNEGDFLTLLGPSGCGKTTTLDTIAGLTRPDTGEIVIDGNAITGSNPENRDTVKVFQEYALFPHMSVGRNVGFGLEMEGVPTKERQERIRESLEMVELGGLEDRQVNELSGGQRQRVATARALVKRPSVLLLDEPFSALDLKLREQLQIELKKLQSELGITTIHVTHDQEEAMILSDKIVVMNDGEKIQEGSPAEIYESPHSEFVANFVGKSNMISGSIVNVGDGLYSAKPNQSNVQFQGTTTNGTQLSVGDDVKICLRPEKCELEQNGGSESNQNCFNATIDHEFLLGAIVQYRLSNTGLEIDNQNNEFIVEDKNLGDSLDFKPGENVNVTYDPKFVKLVKE